MTLESQEVFSADRSLKPHQFAFAFGTEEFIREKSNRPEPPEERLSVVAAYSNRLDACEGQRGRHRYAANGDDFNANQGATTVKERLRSNTVEDTGSVAGVKVSLEFQQRTCVSTRSLLRA